MQLYLIRHAHALDGEDDPARPLSAKGRSQIKRLAHFLRRNQAFAPEAIWHSGLVRARETAELLARRLPSAAPLRAVAGLCGTDDPRVVAKRLARQKHRLALVGHEPHLSALAALLVTGHTAPALFDLKKCGVIALERTGDAWLVSWQVAPALLQKS